MYTVSSIVLLLTLTRHNTLSIWYRISLYQHMHLIISKGELGNITLFKFPIFLQEFYKMKVVYAWSVIRFKPHSVYKYVTGFPYENLISDLQNFAPSFGRLATSQSSKKVQQKTRQTTDQSAVCLEHQKSCRRWFVTRIWIKYLWIKNLVFFYLEET